MGAPFEYQSCDETEYRMPPLRGSYPYTQSILKISDLEFYNLKKSQYLLNRLYGLAAKDIDFVSKAMQPVAHQCGLTSSILEIYQSSELQKGKPRACFGNNVFLCQDKKTAIQSRKSIENNSDIYSNFDWRWKMTAANYMSVEAALQDHLRINLKDEIIQHVELYGFDEHLTTSCNIGSWNDINKILPSPLETNISCIAEITRLLNPSCLRIHYLTKECKATKAIEVQHFCTSMRLRHSIQVSIISWEDLEKATISEEKRDAFGRGQLCLDNGEEISLIFTRTSLFSHVTGRFESHNKSFWTEELKSQLRIMKIYKDIQTKTSAIFIPTLGERLARSRPVEIALKRNLDRFLGGAEAAYLEQVFNDSWEIGIQFSQLKNDEKSELKKKDRLYYKEIVVNSPENSFVAKNILRGYYRPIQAVLEARPGNGRNDAVLIRDKDTLLDIIKSKEDKYRNLFVMFPWINSPVWSASIVSLDGKVHEISESQQGGVVSEIALFGCYVEDLEGNIIYNLVSGVGAKTRPYSSSHPIADEVSFGAIGLIMIG
jgi:hypothetical protein